MSDFSPTVSALTEASGLLSAASHNAAHIRALTTRLKEHLTMAGDVIAELAQEATDFEAIGQQATELVQQAAAYDKQHTDEIAGLKEQLSAALGDSANKQAILDQIQPNIDRLEAAKAGLSNTLAGALNVISAQTSAAPADAAPADTTATTTVDTPTATAPIVETAAPADVAVPITDASGAATGTSWTAGDTASG